MFNANYSTVLQYVDDKFMTIPAKTLLGDPGVASNDSREAAALAECLLNGQELSVVVLLLAFPSVVCSFFLGGQRIKSWIFFTLAHLASWAMLFALPLYYLQPWQHSCYDVSDLGDPFALVFAIVHIVVVLPFAYAVSRLMRALYFHFVAGRGVNGVLARVLVGIFSAPFAYCFVIFVWNWLVDSGLVTSTNIGTALLSVIVMDTFKAGRTGIVSFFSSFFSSMSKDAASLAKYQKEEFLHIINFSLNFYTVKKKMGKDRLYLFFRTIMEKKLSDIIESAPVREAFMSVAMGDANEEAHPAPPSPSALQRTISRFHSAGPIDESDSETSEVDEVIEDVESDNDVDTSSGGELPDPFIKTSLSTRASWYQKYLPWFNQPFKEEAVWPTVMKQTLNAISEQYGQNFLAQSARVKSKTETYVFGLTCEKDAEAKKIRCMLMREKDLKRVPLLEGKRVCFERPNHCLRNLTIRKMAEIYAEEYGGDNIEGEPCSLPFTASENVTLKAMKPPTNSSTTGAPARNSVKRLARIELTFPTQDGKRMKSPFLPRPSTR
uniref:Uncharacterized protein n=1 Tax=Palpitomonas bilix TaxID=652834 RepID=A0A7S3D5R3_9EUKA|mmetsp:Transcript_23405/g.59252  ORF Transcript_23405/g.59252 Transcript_23405/m.59252 type:complete len:550 (+) Transcript_23405:144-1793(+)|eukprot:CAMPEP_0113875716 /NCGR_PEP_ID=MMETSP0780_2-20120614/5094_1 /TAXON_ID=652834 /ORGANISM="Palpitomonas bilix" /LENGTH=549 /DNA_ID=CAMNT_0000861731 /DNA_START=144 /DNA_END=1793 /DNA_ORIENTATION=+ /assembly_acc=CAM_ASM_000599